MAVRPQAVYMYSPMIAPGAHVVAPTGVVLPYSPHVQLQGVVSPYLQPQALVAAQVFNPVAIQPPPPAQPAPPTAPPTSPTSLPSVALTKEEKAAMARDFALQRVMSEGAGPAETTEVTTEVLVARHALELSHDAHGCYLVQQALEEAESDEARLAIAEALRGRIWEIARCPHANHVLQRIVVSVKPSECQFIVDEIAARGDEAFVKLAKHKYAYRLMQRLLEQLNHEQIATVVDQVVAHSIGLSMHRFGTFIVQHALEYGSDKQQARLVSKLCHSISLLSRNNDACMVLDKALAVGVGQSQDVIARAILDCDGALGDMAHTRRGHVVVVFLLQVMGGHLLERAGQILRACEKSLRTTRFGRIVLKALTGQCGGGARTQDADFDA